MPFATHSGTSALTAAGARPLLLSDAEPSVHLCRHAARGMPLTDILDRRSPPRKPTAACRHLAHEHHVLGLPVSTGAHEATMLHLCTWISQAASELIMQSCARKQLRSATSARARRPPVTTTRAKRLQGRALSE